MIYLLPPLSITVLVIDRCVQRCRAPHQRDSDANHDPDPPSLSYTFQFIELPSTGVQITKLDHGDGQEGVHNFCIMVDYKLTFVRRGDKRVFRWYTTPKILIHGHDAVATVLVLTDNCV